MRICLKGVTRIVIVLKSVVIKIPKLVQWDHFIRGILSNIDENRTWKYNSGKYERGASHLLCPVIWCSWGGWILIMKRATPLTREDWDKVNFHNHVRIFPGDDTISNYGFLDSRLVKIDYGARDCWGEYYKDD